MRACRPAKRCPAVRSGPPSTSAAANLPHLCVEECVGGLAAVADGQQLVIISEGTGAQHEARQLNISNDSRRQHQPLQLAVSIARQLEGTLCARQACQRQQHL